MTDPSSNVPQHLLRHVHLVCNKQYPVMHRSNVNAILQYLLEAPRTVRDEASMTWKTLVEPQPDGKVMLVWQSRHKTDFATDGYVWLDAERSQIHREGRHTIEFYTQNNGYRQTTDQVTLHARRRYRLVPSQAPTPTPQVDPCLWIVHYYQTEPQNQIPISSLAIPEQVKQLMSEQRTLQAHRQLQLQHNEFMLHDRNKWPSIHAPGVPAPPYSQQAMVYPNNVMAQMSRNHVPAYHQYPQGAISQAAIGPSPAKRPRHASMNQAPPSTTALSHHLDTRDALVTDDDTPDYMDVLTPREISSLRYKQHHEWLEEILSSPYDTYQILPEELGLGRKGELESLTRDFFVAHTSKNTGSELREPRTPTERDVENGDNVVDDDPPPRVGRLAEGKAVEFKRLAAERLEKIQHEMESMRAEHAQHMTKLKDIDSWREADEQIRSSTWSAINGKATPTDLAAADDLVKTLEQKSGKSLRPFARVECIEKGGYEDKRPERTIKSTSDPKASTPLEESMAAPHLSTSSSSSEKPPVVTEPPPDPILEDQPTKINSPPVAVPVAVEDQPPPPKETSQPPSGENTTDDWIVVEGQGEATDVANELSAFDSFTNDSAMQLDDKPEEGAGDLEATTAMQLGDTEFDAGLDLADFNTTGPDLSTYDNLGGSELEGSGVPSLGNHQASSPRQESRNTTEQERS